MKYDMMPTVLFRIERDESPFDKQTACAMQAGWFACVIVTALGEWAARRHAWHQALAEVLAEMADASEAAEPPP